MKKILFFMILLCPIVLGGCSSDDDDWMDLDSKHLVKDLSVHLRK